MAKQSRRQPAIPPGVLIDVPSDPAPGTGPVPHLLSSPTTPPVSTTVPDTRSSAPVGPVQLDRLTRTTPRRRDAALWLWPVVSLTLTALLGQALGTRAAALCGICLLGTFLLFVGGEVLGPVTRLGVAAGCMALLLLMSVSPSPTRVRNWWAAPPPVPRTNDPVDWRGRLVTAADVEGRVALPDARLSGAFLNGLSLKGLDFRGAAAAGASFDRANLSWTTWKGADLRGATLRGACLRHADFSGADLAGVDAAGADIRDATIPPAERAGGTWPDPTARSSDVCSRGDRRRSSGTG